MKHKKLKIIIALSTVFIIASLALIMSHGFTTPMFSPGIMSGEAKEKCEHASHEKSYVYYNDYDHLINYICNDCGCLFDSGNYEHTFWDIENSCVSTTCNLCGHTCDHPKFNGTQCEACHFVCEHEFQYEFSTTGGACLKCGRYCCTHEKEIKVDLVILCKDCGRYRHPWE